MTHPRFSIIIPAYNAAKTLRQCLEAVSQLASPLAREVIVIDDGSTDTTAALAQAFEGVRYFFQENRGPAAARNRGAREAKGEILCFTDSDCLPRADWLDQLNAAFTDENVAAVAGSYDAANARSLLAAVINDEIAYRHEKLLPAYPEVFGSYNVAIRKNVFDAVGGFDEDYLSASGEDNDLSYRIRREGFRIFFAREARVAHYHTEKILPYLKEQGRHGFWRVRLYKEHPRMVRGDHYTFWKDMIEVPLACAGLAACALVIAPGLPAAAKFSGVLLVLVHILLEAVFGVIISGPKRKGFLLALVMFLRSYARTFGFISGLLCFPRMAKEKRKILSRSRS